MSTDGHREAETVRALRRIADAMEGIKSAAERIEAALAQIEAAFDGDDPDPGDEYELAAHE